MIRDDQLAWLKLAWREGLSAVDAAGLSAVAEDIAKKWFKQFAADQLPRLREMPPRGRKALAASRAA